MPFAELSSPIAPTAIVEPLKDSARLAPKLSAAPVLDALTYASWCQLVSSRVNTYTAPAEAAALLAWSPLIPRAALFSTVAATASVEPSPDSETRPPKLSCFSAFDALMYACCCQVAPARVNT